MSLPDFLVSQELAFILCLLLTGTVLSILPSIYSLPTLVGSVVYYINFADEAIVTYKSEEVAQGCIGNK